MSHYKQKMYEKQGHWTPKNRSCWPWLYDPQVNVTRLSHVSLTIFISCFHNRKVEKHFLKLSWFWPLAPPWGMDPGVRSHGMKADPPGYLLSKYECFLMSGWRDIPHLRNFNVKLLKNPLMRWKEVERMNIWTDERKDKNYISLGINAGVQLSRVFVISFFRVALFRLFVISSFRLALFRLFVISSFRLPVLMRSSNCHSLFNLI